VSPKALAQAYLAAGDKEQALTWLEEAYRQRCPTLALIQAGGPRWDPVRADPRFLAVLRNMGLK
jgi:hypothetical protein